LTGPRGAGEAVLNGIVGVIRSDKLEEMQREMDVGAESVADMGKVEENGCV